MGIAHLGKFVYMYDVHTLQIIPHGNEADTQCLRCYAARRDPTPTRTMSFPFNSWEMQAPNPIMQLALPPAALLALNSVAGLQTKESLRGQQISPGLLLQGVTCSATSYFRETRCGHHLPEGLTMNFKCNFKPLQYDQRLPEKAATERKIRAPL